MGARPPRPPPAEACARSSGACSRCRRAAPHLAVRHPPRAPADGWWVHAPARSLAELARAGPKVSKPARPGSGSRARESMQTPWHTPDSHRCSLWRPHSSGSPSPPACPRTPEPPPSAPRRSRPTSRPPAPTRTSPPSRATSAWCARPCCAWSIRNANTTARAPCSPTRSSRAPPKATAAKWPPRTTSPTSPPTAKRRCSGCARAATSPTPKSGTWSARTSPGAPSGWQRRRRSSTPGWPPPGTAPTSSTPPTAKPASGSPRIPPRRSPKGRPGRFTPRTSARSSPPGTPPR